MTNDRSSPDGLKKTTSPAERVATPEIRKINSADLMDSVDQDTGSFEQMVRSIWLTEQNGRQGIDPTDGPDHSLTNTAKVVLDAIRLKQKNARLTNPLPLQSQRQNGVTVDPAEILTSALHAAADRKNFKHNEFRALARSAATMIKQHALQLDRLWDALMQIETLGAPSEKSDSEMLDALLGIVQKVVAERNSFRDELLRYSTGDS